MKTKNLFLMISLLVANFINGQPPTIETNLQHNAVTLTSVPNSPISTAINAPLKFMSIDNTNTLFGAAAIPSSGQINNWENFLNGADGTVGAFRNSAFGQRALRYNETGSDNTAVGVSAKDNARFGDGNSAFGRSALIRCEGNNNSALGHNSGGFGTTFTGSNNTFLGANVTTTNSNLLNTVLIGDGSGAQRIYIHSNGFTGIGLGNNPASLPQNMLELNGGIANTSGLRFRNYKSNVVPTLTDTKFLTVNTDGDVLLRNLPTLGIQFTATCATVNYIPKSTGATTMGCSQIFDNTSVTIPIANSTVTIGYSTQPTNFAFTTIPPGNLGNPTAPGTIRLKVNGVTEGLAYFATSDKRFKKDILPIENALKTIEAIEGKTYLWDKEKNKEMNFDGGGHSGFIAQELEKVLPHLVATGSDGFKAINYMELLPYLVEAIKEQQAQISELKAQASNSFKTQNGELLTLENTKIISVSPNPSNDVILVSMNIEKVVQNAKLLVHDINGTVLSSLNINERDTNITKTLQKDNFGKGIYVVSLVINGKSIDTKKIVFN